MQYSNETYQEGIASSKNKLSLGVLSGIASVALMSIAGSPVSANSQISVMQANGCITSLSYTKKDDADFLQNDLSSTQSNFLTKTFFQSSSSDLISTVKNEISHDPTAENLHTYLSLYLKQIEKHPDYLSIDKAKAIGYFFKSALKISKIPFEKSAVHLLPENGYKFILRNGNKLLMISQTLNGEDMKSDEVVYSLFENKELIISDLTKIDRFVDEIKIYLAS